MDGMYSLEVKFAILTLWALGLSPVLELCGQADEFSRPARLPLLYAVTLGLCSLLKPNPQKLQVPTHTHKEENLGTRVNKLLRRLGSINQLEKRFLIGNFL